MPVMKDGIDEGIRPWSQHSPCCRNERALLTTERKLETLGLIRMILTWGFWWIECYMWPADHTLYMRLQMFRIEGCEDSFHVPGRKCGEEVLCVCRCIRTRKSSGPMKTDGMRPIKTVKTALLCVSVFFYVWLSTQVVQLLLQQGITLL